MNEITFEDIKILVSALFRNKLLIALFTITGLCVGMLYSARQQAEYTYSATASVSVVFAAGATQGMIPGTAVLANYAEIVTSSRVAEYAAGLLEAERITAQQVQSMVSAATRATSYILRITARGADPRHTIMVANAVAESFVSQVSVITGNDSIQVLDVARSASLSSPGGGGSIRMIAPVAAFIFACLLIAVMELLSGKVRSVKQCVDDMGELLAVIPQAPKTDKTDKKQNKSE